MATRQMTRDSISHTESWSVMRQQPQIALPVTMVIHKRDAVQEEMLRPPNAHHPPWRGECKCGRHAGGVSRAHSSGKCCHHSRHLATAFYRDPRPAAVVTVVIKMTGRSLFLLFWQGSWRKPDCFEYHYTTNIQLIRGSIQTTVNIMGN